MEFAIKSNSEDVNGYLTVSRVSLRIGSGMLLIWSDFGVSGPPKRAVLGGNPITLLDLARPASFQVVDIVPGPAAMDLNVEFGKPILVGET